MNLKNAMAVFVVMLIATQNKETIVLVMQNAGGAKGCLVKIFSEKIKMVADLTMAESSSKSIKSLKDELDTLMMVW